jgi:hypothetical protein
MYFLSVIHMSITSGVAEKLKTRKSDSLLSDPLHLLSLTLHRQAFDVMVTGEKKFEYRRISEWINSRLYCSGKKKRLYKYVKFFHGYISSVRPTRRFFLAKYKGFRVVASAKRDYSNGLSVDCADPIYEIRIGSIYHEGVEYFKFKKTG